MYVPDMGNGRGHSSGSTYFQARFLMGTEKKWKMQVIVQEVTGLMFAALLGILLLSLSTATEEAIGKRRWLFLSGSRDLPWFLEKYAAVIRRSVFMFPGSCLSDDKGKKSEKYRKHPVLAICVSGGTGVLFYE